MNDSPAPDPMRAVQQAIAAVTLDGPDAVARAIGDVDHGHRDGDAGHLFVRLGPRDAGAWSQVVVVGQPDGGAFVTLTPAPSIRLTVAAFDRALGHGRPIPGPVGRSYRWDVTTSEQRVVVFAELDPDGAIEELSVRRD